MMGCTDQKARDHSLDPINLSHQSNQFDIWLETETGINALEGKGLSRRESEVMKWVARGKANSEIGMILYISPRTVSKHLENIYCKLGVECRTAAVVSLLEIMQESTASQKEGAEALDSRTAQSRVLLVDDDPGTRLVIRSMLEYYGYTCDEVEHGAAALAYLKAAQVDLVITDNRMPVLGGIQFLEHLSTSSSEDMPPVIMYTGKVNEELKEKAFKAGAYALLQKPSSTEALLSVVSQAIRSRCLSTLKYSVKPV